MRRKTGFLLLGVLVASATVASSTASAAGLVGWWKFDETSGTTAADSSGKGNNGRVVGTAQWVAGKVGGAFQFDGSTYIDCGNGASLNVTEQITMAFWFKVDAFTNTWEAFLAKGDGSYRSARSGGTGNATHMGISGSNYFDAPTVVTDNEWHFWTGTYDGATAIIYLDGNVDAQRAYTGPLGDGSGYNLYIGENAQATGRQLHGLLDDVRIYDRALTAQQIQDLMTTGASPVWLKAEKPSPADGETGVLTVMLSWTKGDGAIRHNVYLGTTPELTATDKITPNPLAASKTSLYAGDLTPGVTYYWRVDELDSKSNLIAAGDVWSFTTAPLCAYAPTPANGARCADPNVVLSWQPGQNALVHELYFSTDKAAVENRDPAALQTGVDDLNYTFTPGTLALVTTYYWVVDETDVDENKTPGELWSFRTWSPEDGLQGEYFNGQFAGAPVLTRVDQTINFEFGNGSPGGDVPADTFSARWTGDLKVEVADTYTFTTRTDDGVRLWLNDRLIVDSWVDQGSTDHSSAALPLGRGVYSIRMEYYENTGGAAAHLDWSTPTMARQSIPTWALSLPRLAKAIYPLGGDVNVPQDVVLIWTPGPKAAQHAVYFGTDPNAVENATPDTAGVFQGLQGKGEVTFAPGTLDFNTPYYWRIDEVNSAETYSPWKGLVMSFTTGASLIIDGFESYNGDYDNEVFSFWLDNYDVTGDQSGSIVGTDAPPFVATSAAVVHSGRQAMPLHYNNAGPKYLFSETKRVFDKPKDLTANGGTTLSLWVKGVPAPFVDKGNNAYSLSAAGNDIWNAADCFRFAYKALNGNGSITVKVDSLTRSNGWSKAGIMIRETLDTGSANVALVMSSDNGVSFQWRDTLGGTSGNSGTAGLKAPYWLRLTRTGDVFKAECSPDGVKWTPVGSDHTTTMAASVYIGLAVTSHNAALVSEGQFSNVTSTAAGSFTVADIGLDPEPTNSVAPLYVVLEDSSGKSFAVTHPDPAAVNFASYTLWEIPLSSFTGVNTTKVKTMYLGVGNRKTPVKGGSGDLWIDDIRVTK
jgi:regulation of enolase protein 1 (concanavalin A-like superfamily)